MVGGEGGLDEDRHVSLGGARFRRREVVLPGGGRLAYVEAHWRSALVVVERGAIELHCRRGGVRRFGTGALLVFDGLGLRALRNPGTEPMVLVAHFRRDRTRRDSATRPHTDE